jgi:hypothetical protein
MSCDAILPPTEIYPYHIVQKWMGYAQLSTTAIYADAGAVGKGRTAHRGAVVGVNPQFGICLFRLSAE